MNYAMKCGARVVALMTMTGLIGPSHSAPMTTPTATSASAAEAPGPLDFKQALLLVLARDPQVRGARATLAEARAQSNLAKSRLWPHAGVSASYGKSKDEDLIDSQTGQTAAVSRKTSLAQGYLRWNLFNGFADKTEIDASKKDVEASRAEARRAFDDAGERTALAYFDVLRLQLLADRSAQRRREVEELGRLVRRQTEAGKGSAADGELVASSLIDARVGDDTVRADLATARIKLQTLLGTAFGRLSETAPVPLTTTEEPLDRLIERAYAGNAQWRAAQLRTEAAIMRIGPIPPEYLPKLDLELRRRLSGSTVPDNSTSQTQQGWSLNLVYDVPLGGEVDARRKALQQRALAAEADAMRIGDDVRNQLGDVQHHGHQAIEAMPQLEQQVQHLNAVVRASELLWDAGRRSLLQLIEVRDTRYLAQQREADNRLRLINARVHQLLLTGELANAVGIEDESLGYEGAKAATTASNAIDPSQSNGTTRR